jgi:acetylornithine deacetylase
VGLISGGVAPNVVSPSAEAEVMFRIVGDPDEVRRAMAPLERTVAIEHILDVTPVRLTTVPGFETAVFPYTTDIPFLHRWGAPLLIGPGSVHEAHTANESVAIAELQAAVGHYEAIAAALLQRLEA